MAACRPLVAYKQKLQDILHEGIALDILKRIGRARMRLEQLTYLVSAAKAGSISAAAQRLNVSRQAVSSALGSLESELGVPFFKKGNQGIEPTFRGRAILEKAEAVLKLIEELRAEGRMDGTGNFSVCTTPLLSLYLTNSVFLPFRELHPEINVLLRNVYLPELMGELENGASRIAVVRTSVDMTIRERAREIGCEVVPLFVDEGKAVHGGDPSPGAKGCFDTGRPGAAAYRLVCQGAGAYFPALCAVLRRGVLYGDPDRLSGSGSEERSCGCFSLPPVPS